MEMANILGEVHSIHVGEIKDFIRPNTKSAINKRPVNYPIQVHKTGLVGDEHADAIRHGGLDKAVHLYAFEHYQRWKQELGSLPLLDAAGAFGENISTFGFTEEHIYLGDRFQIGDVLLEVTQGRQPCWKLNDYFGIDDMALRVQASLRTGFYCRVLVNGYIAPKQKVLLVSRGNSFCNLKELMEIIFQDEVDKKALTQLLQLPLVPSWRQMILRRINSGKKECVKERILGPSNA